MIRKHGSSLKLYMLCCLVCLCFIATCFQFRLLKQWPTLTESGVGPQEALEERLSSIPALKSAERITEEGKEFFHRLTLLGAEKWQNAAFGSSTLSKEDIVLVNHTYNVAADILLRPLSHPSRQRAPKIEINCSNPIYADALTGKVDPNDKYIVDVALFGFDVDFLEIRLLEYYDIVDSFVVPEQDVTFKGIPKPLLVPTLLETRLESFRNKIDYQQLRFIEYYKNIFQDQELNFKQKKGKMWQIQHNLRSDIFNYVKKKYERSSDNVYVIQNDGDEMISRTAMAHFKKCELRDPKKAFYFPDVQFKRNVAWVMETYDMRARLSFHGQDSVKSLENYLWALGPTITRLAESSAKLFRIHPWKYKQGFCHMGLGAASHFSNPKKV